jgi:hypothetical protein
LNHAEIEGRRYLWRDVLAARRAQLAACRKAQQPPLFELRDDCPATERTAAGRYREPSLSRSFSRTDARGRSNLADRRGAGSGNRAEAFSITVIPIQARG